MGVLLSEREEMLKEMLSVTRNIDHIKDIVAMQQNYATVSGVTERVQITELAEDAVRMHARGFSQLDLRVVRDYEPGLAEIIVDRHKVLQILVNIIRNAVQACEASGHQENRLTIRAAAGKDCVRLQVQDNGVGIPRENLISIFNHGFTTRPGGHGFGLHMSALAAKELGGSLTVESDGPGMGAAFTLELPLRPPVSE
jgi:signal transduction histidine kinase